MGQQPPFDLPLLGRGRRSPQPPIHNWYRGVP
jgi:hypothetical protein